MKANASKHKAMSYGRMTEKEKEFAEEVEKLLRKAESVDAEEDARCGKGVKGDDIPEDLRFRKTRLEKIREGQEGSRRAGEERKWAFGEGATTEGPDQLHRCRK